jgi:peroxiredoxin
VEPLQVGTRFPRLEVKLVGGGSLLLPDDLQGHPAIVLFYRGHW